MQFDFLNVARRRAAAIGVRGLLIAGFAATLAGCNTFSDTTGSIPVAYRDRHPITLNEGKKSLVLFVGAGRGDSRRRNAPRFWPLRRTGLATPPAASPSTVRSAASTRAPPMTR